MEPLEVAAIVVGALGGFRFMGAKTHDGRMMGLVIGLLTLGMTGAFLSAEAVIYCAGACICGILLGTIVSGLRGDSPPPPPNRRNRRRRR